jgi:Family of unknown function (DUF6194)
MDQETIIHYITETFTGLEVQRPTDGPGAGDTFIFYDPNHDTDPTRRMPFATIVTKDYGDFDNSSHLERPDVFRLNIGVSRETFRSLFGYLPNEEPAEGVTYDFAVLDKLMPHPAYGRQSWVCVLNPSLGTFETVKPLLAEAYTLAANRYEKKKAGSGLSDATAE